MTDEQMDERTRKEIERHRLKALIVVLGVVTALILLVTYGPSDAEIEGGAGGTQGVELDVQLTSGDGCMGYRDLVERAFGAREANTACRVMWCESRGNPNAVSPTNDHGLLQINAGVWNKPHHSDPVAQFIGHHWGVVYDPWSNLVMAQKIQHHYGWAGQWSCY